MSNRLQFNIKTLSMLMICRKVFAQYATEIDHKDNECTSKIYVLIFKLQLVTNFWIKNIKI